VDREILLEKVREACEEFERQNGRKPSKREKNKINGFPARMTSLAFDKKVNKFYTATSGRAPSRESFNSLLKERMPNPSLESGRDPESCAEVQAANKALNNRPDAQISDLIIATILTGDGAPQIRCENCKVTLRDALVITDEMAEQEVKNVQIQ
jgi:hypothetical protein